MKITGARPNTEFRLTCKPSNLAALTFVAVHGDEVHVTRSAAQIAELPDDTPVVAHWHGERRTDGFAMTVVEFRAQYASDLSMHVDVPRGLFGGFLRCLGFVCMLPCLRLLATKGILALSYNIVPNAQLAGFRGDGGGSSCHPLVDFLPGHDPAHLP